MSKDWPPPILKSYTLEKVSPSHSPTTNPPIAKVILRGENFFNRAVSPTVKIGEMEILDCEIMPSEQAMVLYLFERPPEGGKITVSYEPEEVGELEEPFHWDV